MRRCTPLKQHPYCNNHIKFYNKKCSLLIILLLFAFTLTGCSGTIYKIEPEGRGDSSEKVIVNVKPGEESTKAEEVKNSDDSSSTDATSDSESEISEDTNSSTVENSEQNLSQDISDSSSDTTEKANELVESLFVNQFSSVVDFDLQVSIDELDNTSTSWTFSRNPDHLPVRAHNTFDITRYGGYYIKNTNEKVVYLTFDQGYENGFTPKILDVLKDNNVKAAFFITGDYIKRAPDLVVRMAEEGHIVANHSVKHPEFPTLSESEIFDELTELADSYEALIGRKMDPFFRPPAGKYSERVLYLTRKLGYRTIFWSMAYKDWLINEQPGKEVAYQHVLDNYHNGSIILLHAVSESNTEALDSILKDLIALGYRFGSLYELE
jgi:peptidoglycan-N-acetylmuramic acid deacetylase